MPSITCPSGPIALKPSSKDSAKAAHVNMMTDTIIANMPPEGLRVLLRGLLGVDPKVTTKLNSLAAEYLNASRPTEDPQLFFARESPIEGPALLEIQQRYRCMMGCGMGFESMRLLSEVIRQVLAVVLLEGQEISERLMDSLAIIDADIVQSVTAIQKELLTTSGPRRLSALEVDIVQTLLDGLLECEKRSRYWGAEFAFERGLSRIRKVEGISEADNSTKLRPVAAHSSRRSEASVNSIESFQLGTSLVPRMFMGKNRSNEILWI